MNSPPPPMAPPTSRSYGPNRRSAVGHRYLIWIFDLAICVGRTRIGAANDDCRQCDYNVQKQLIIITDRIDHKALYAMTIHYPAFDEADGGKNVATRIVGRVILNNQEQKKKRTSLERSESK
ncbi:hypothetical protein EVAR_75084_1 [Eumeta japonica]|uniref:Uncharacterized protein n=1 Tax=Eumeta variegata TaxID=151549 RepID=A0A4C1W3E0_EUMVA|nr:hypothetical protein EVAR_75084_1 [Eumeta japonica]